MPDTTSEPLSGVARLQRLAASLSAEYPQLEGEDRSSRERLDQALAEFRASVAEMEEQSQDPPWLLQLEALAERVSAKSAALGLREYPSSRRDHLRVLQGGRESSKDGDDA